ncbi:MAG: hypothetical protein SVY41_00855 [Candidatus Nanohaloarchaea archaeon]|nr:hypothetical protein [Candidatus Nanohaloarchaea archaeon]
MKVLRYVLLAYAAGLAGVWYAVSYLPSAEFTPLVPAVMRLGVIGLAAATIAALFLKDRVEERGKRVLMTVILLLVLLPTVYAAGAWMHGVFTSWSAGEVHYHADYEVVVEDGQGEYHQLDLIDPGEFCQRTQHESTYMCKLNDRVGATEYHEHNDRRIHLEGTFKQKNDASIAAFFDTFGGELSNDRLVYPTDEKVWNVSETGDRSLKILVKRGVGGTRHWCAIGPGSEVTAAQVCNDPYTGIPARSPSQYAISPFQRGPTLDDIWVIYDTASVDGALADLREDDRYKQFQKEKTGEGY